MRRLPIYLTMLLTACSSSPDFDFTGMWQSLNDQGVFEFREDGKLILHKDGKSFYSLVTQYGELDYQVEHQKNNWYSLRTFDGGEPFFVKGRIEVVTANRIRIYIHKHHDILDVADEYHRTSGPGRFRAIMDKIKNEPE